MDATEFDRTVGGDWKDGGMTWHRRLLLPAVLCAALSACSGNEPAPAPDPAPESSAPAVEPSPSPAFLSPLTGRPADADDKVLMMKIDNTGPARPLVGLEAADVVYIQQVEGGLTRLAAVFGSRIPARIGPVRSARITDLELMRQYGRPGFVYSGANRAFVPAIRRAPLVDLSPDSVGGSYARLGGRRAPYNLFANGKRLLAARPRVGDVKDVGFRFGPPPEGGRPAKQVTARYPGATARFVWSPEEKRWLWTMDGTRMQSADGERLGASTVVVQNVRIEASPFRDKNRNSTPYMRTVGKGKATILRDGRAYDGTWERPSATAGTTYRVGGQPVNFAPGQVWVALTGMAPSVS